MQAAFCPSHTHKAAHLGNQGGGSKGMAIPVPIHHVQGICMYSVQPTARCVVRLCHSRHSIEAVMSHIHAGIGSYSSIGLGPVIYIVVEGYCCLIGESMA